MAPTTKKIFNNSNAITTRSKNSLVIAKEPRIKRKADGSPTKNTLVKRKALGDVTNDDKKLDNKNKALLNKDNNIAKKVIVKTKELPSLKTVVRCRQNENLPPPVIANKIQTRATTRNIVVPDQTAQKPKEAAPKENTGNSNKVKTRLSNEFEKTDESLYSSALEEINVSDNSNLSSQKGDTRSKSASAESIANSTKPGYVTLVAQEMEVKLNLDDQEMPPGVVDFDQENWNDIFQVSHYAKDIFNYMRSRESKFVIPDYMDRQVCLTRWMRSLLIDWMVEIQESFELNHETLYLGVKLVDIYLSRVMVSKEMLQLVGAAAVFIASKFDERIPPAIEDFLYICDGAYKIDELKKMEISVLKVCDFDLGIPLSYRFLRRFARCAKVTMPILTLARFILEYSLMEYATVTILDSKLAAASLYLALQMKKVSGWTPTLEYYTGYKLNQIINVVHLLNDGLHRKPKEQLMTVRNKYSHKIFFEVAKTPLVSNDDLRP